MTVRGDFYRLTIRCLADLATSHTAKCPRFWHNEGMQKDAQNDTPKPRIDDASVKTYVPDETEEKASGDVDAASSSAASESDAPKEIGGRDGPDPTRYGDWEKNGRCIDF